MDTVSKVVNAATAALWGDGSSVQQQTSPHGEEPIAGVQGKGNFNDPFDAGNREEQPEAPTSEENTALQEPRLDGAKTDPTRKDLIEDIKTDDVDQEKTTTTAPIAAPPTLSSSALSPVPVIGASTSSTPAEAGGSSSTGLTSEPKTEHEQRTTESTSGQSSQASHAAEHREVSEEALKGPQGPAPVGGEEFEKEAKGMKPATKDRGAIGNGSSKSIEKAPQGGEKGNGNGKHSPLHKMKEKLSKVAHPRHGNNKA